MSEKIVKRYASKLEKVTQKNGLKRLASPDLKTQERFWRSAEKAGLIGPFELRSKIAKVWFNRLMQTKISWLKDNGVLGLMTVIMVGVVMAALNDGQGFTFIFGGIYLYVLLNAWADKSIKEFAVRRILKFYLVLTIMYALFWYF